MTEATMQEIRSAEGLTEAKLGAPKRMLCAGFILRRNGTNILLKYKQARVDAEGRIENETKAKRNQKGIDKTATI